VVQIHSPRPFVSSTYAASFPCELGPVGSSIGLNSPTSAAPANRPLADLRQADARQVPLPWIYLSEFFVLCGGDDLLDDLEELHDGLFGKVSSCRPTQRC
jgi:hypothetical protein